MSLVAATVALSGCYTFRRVSDPFDAGSETDARAPDASLRAPRAVAPISAGWVPSRAPMFRWEFAPDTDGVRLELCRDRACTNVVHSEDVPDTHWRPSADLPAGILFWHLAGLRGSTLNTPWSATWELAVRARSGPTDTVDGSLVDMNGDGFGDVVVGAPHAAGDAGQVFVYFGGTAGLPTEPSLTIDAPIPAVVGFGQVVASAGDLDGDGFADLAVGAPDSESSTGYVFVYAGGAPFSPTVPIATIRGPDGAGGRFGAWITSIGDADRDGYGDLAVTAFGVGGTRGRVYVFSGGPAGLVSRPAVTLDTTAGAGAQFGQLLSPGDVNGDGFGDLMIAEAGWNGYHGRAWIFEGGVAGITTTAATLIDSYGQTFGAVLSGSSDFDGDGYTDFTTTSMSAPNGGRAYVFPGSAMGIAPTTTTTIDSPDTAGIFAEGTWSAGDVNADGYDDLLVAGAGYLNFTGRAHLYLGSASGVGTTPAAMWVGPDGPNGRFAWILAGLSDVDGDGIDDFAISAPPRSGSGKVYVFAGNATASFPSARWVLQRPSALGFGEGLARAR